MHFSLLAPGSWFIDTLVTLSIHASPIFNTIALMLPTLKYFLAPVHLLLKWAYSCILHSILQLGLSSPECLISTVHTGFRMCSASHGLNTEAVLKGYSCNRLTWTLRAYVELPGTWRWVGMLYSIILKQIFCKNQQGGAKLLYIKYIAFLFKNETQNSQKILWKIVIC